MIRTLGALALLLASAVTLSACVVEGPATRAAPGLKAITVRKAPGTPATASKA